MNTQAASITNSMWTAPNNHEGSSHATTAGKGSNFRIVLTKSSQKQTPGGYSLADIIKAQGRFDDKRAISTCIAILKTLFERMSEGGEAFPGNLTPSGIIFKEDGRIELMEGAPEITLVSRPDLDGRESIISGIPAYMSPESVTGLNEGSRFGIYTFGAIMYEMLTGLPPYRGNSPLNTMNAIKQGPPMRLTQVNPATNRKLVAICERCMNRRISCRYPSLFDVLSDLEKLQSEYSSKGTVRIKGWVSSMLAACF